MLLKKLIIVVLAIAATGFAAENDSTRIKFSGWGWLTLGRVESSIHQTVDYDINFEKEWLVDFVAGLKAVKGIGKYGKVRLHFGLSTAYIVLDYRKQNAEFLRKKFVPFLIDATMEYKFALSKGQTLYTEFGYFPVKYNPQATNLGEYLFRSGTYPGYLNSGFELADKEKLAGLHMQYQKDFSNDGWFRGDLFFTNGMREFPVHDFDLSYILSTKPMSFVEVAAGISHAHILTLDERKTTPATDTVVFRPGVPTWNHVGWIDTTTGDTIEYTFKGAKAMARLTLDPKAFFKTEIFGKEDMKIYCEAALLGFKNYPGWYENIEERVPIMFGFNFPAFKILDVLSIEGEWYGFKHWNTEENVWKNRSPVPYTGSIISYIDDWEERTNDDWKWSVYASKKFSDRFRISGQIASDHIKRTVYMPPPPSFSKYTEIVPRSRDWYWMVRTMFYF